MILFWCWHKSILTRAKHNLQCAPGDSLSLWSAEGQWWVTLGWDFSWESVTSYRSTSYLFHLCLKMLHCSCDDCEFHMSHTRWENKLKCIQFTKKKKGSQASCAAYYGFMQLMLYSLLLRWPVRKLFVICHKDRLSVTEEPPCCSKWLLLINCIDNVIDWINYRESNFEDYFKDCPYFFKGTFTMKLYQHNGESFIYCQCFFIPITQNSVLEQS